MLRGSMQLRRPSLHSVGCVNDIIIREQSNHKLWDIANYLSTHLLWSRWTSMDLPPVTGRKHLLVLVDLFSGWVEAFPPRKADAVSVAKCLLKDIIPRFGVMTRLESDQGPHFTSQIIQHIAKALGIKQALHTPIIHKAQEKWKG